LKPKAAKPDLVTTGLGWPEGPAILADGSLVFVESYRSQLSVVGKEGGPARRLAYTAGAPNSCVLGSDGAFYVCQNGNTVGPWRAPQASVPSIQKVLPDGKVEILCTEVDSITLKGPNDLVFSSDGRLIFTDPGVYNPNDPNPYPNYIFALAPDGTASVVMHFAKPVFPNGIAVEPDGSIVWNESYTGRLRRKRPNGSVEDLGRMPGQNPIPDGMKIGSDGRFYVTDIFGKGIHVVRPDGHVDGFIAVGAAPTNCAFDGEILWVTDAAVLAASNEPNFTGQLWQVRIPGGGAPTYRGAIAQRGK
jgi:gluconolactonase